jgi:[ribosomal protein S18]-alanine N-acetyltransferase
MQAFTRPAYGLKAAMLRALSPENAADLGEALATMPPWSIIGWPASGLTSAFLKPLPGVYRFEVVSEGAIAGIVTVQQPFLHGPYLQLLAILPPFQGKSFGRQILQWLEDQARLDEARQSWLCVSTFNARALSFYEEAGFERVAVLEKLASDRSDELLMRKRLLSDRLASDA